MKKKLTMIAVAVLALVVALFALAACKPEHEHVWSEWVLTDPPTCTQDGSETRTCDCGETETRIVKALEHAWGEEITQPATLMKEGKRYRICSVCNEEQAIETLPRLTSDAWDGTVPSAMPETYVVDDRGNVSLYSASALAWFGVKSASNRYAGKTITLMADVDLQNKPFAPMFGSAAASADAAIGAFEGTFDGNGYTISNLTVNAEEDAKNIALFAVAGEGATIKNLTVKNALIAVRGEPQATGVIVGAIYGATVKDCKVDGGSVSGFKGVGGIAGRMYACGIIDGCENSATVSGKSIGGIVGQAYYSRTGKTMTMKNCVNNGAVESTYAGGGVTSLTCGVITDCVNNGTIKAAAIAGGIVAELNMGGRVETSVNSADVTGGNAGGIVGWIRYTSSAKDYRVVSTAEVVGCSNGANVVGNGLGSGGIVGILYSAALIEGNVNNAALIGGTSTFAAGIVGGIQNAESNNAFGQPGWNDAFKADDVRLIGNKTTTALDAVTGSCRDALAYVNAPEYVVKEGNVFPA